MLNKELQVLLEEQYLGRRISVPVPERDQDANAIPNRFVQCTGQCTFIGSNPHMNWELQVTVDGLPIQVNHVNDIKLLPELTTRLRK